MDKKKLLSKGEENTCCQIVETWQHDGGGLSIIGYLFLRLF